MEESGMVEIFVEEGSLQSMVSPLPVLPILRRTGWGPWTAGLHRLREEE
jgi:hypothetical protein